MSDQGLDAVVDPVVDWFAVAARPLPWRDADVTPWGVLVSEFMLQQTQAARVVPRWRDFVARWPRPVDLAAASEADVLRAWDRLGYPRRARWLRQCAIAIVEQHRGEVPADETALRALPGVGPYTAAAVACFAYGRPTAVVDTNVRRVIARAVVGSAEPWAPSAPRDHAEYRAVVPEPSPGDAAGRRRAVAWNAAAMELGALVCTARNPECDACPISNACAWHRAGSPSGTVAGTPRRRQAAYAGSDRQMRGAVLAALRASPGGVAGPELRDMVHAALGTDAGSDAPRYERAIAGLESDGLIAVVSGRVALPGDADAP
ncbi:MAG: A/G-specific adenine glycosylase [Pseudoclavibacter sp.]